jgi:hypothetical protein
MEGGAALIVKHVHTGIAAEQRGHGVRMATAGGRKQWGPAQRVLLVDNKLKEADIGLGDDFLQQDVVACQGHVVERRLLAADCIDNNLETFSKSFMCTVNMSNKYFIITLRNLMAKLTKGNIMCKIVLSLKATCSGQKKPDS